MITLLNKGGLTVKTTFTAERFSLNLSERQSTAAVTVGPEAPTISVGDWLRDEEDPGKGIVWRVKTVDTDYATDTRTIQCEHMITALKDRVLFGEVTPAMMAGKTNAKNCTALQAARYILNASPDWTLGSLGFDKSAPYAFNGDDLFGALETVSSSLLEAWWSYDFTSYPFKVSIQPRATAVTCEMRMDRNIKTLKKTVDRSRMFTRFYPIGKNNLTIGGSGYVEKNASVYGVICKVETDNEKDTADKLKAWANERLNNHAEPAVTVTISGLELSATTGESLDKLTLGRVCRVPLPEFDTTITERITKLNWSDKIADPESVSVTLANEFEDVAAIINNLAKSAGKSGRGSAKNAQEDHAWFVDTDEKVGMVAEAVGGKDANGNPNWSRVSQLTVDGNGIDARVTKTEGDIVTHESKINQTENSISQVVTAVGKDGKVTAASIITAINDDKSSITISADKVKIQGKTTLNDVMTIDSNRVWIKKHAMFGTSSSNLVSINGGNVTAQSLTLMNNAANTKVAYSDLQGMVKSVSVSNNTLKITKWNGDVVNFSKATGLTGSWSGGTLTVQAKQQNGSSETVVNTLTRHLAAGTPSWDGNVCTVPVRVWYGQTPPTYEDTEFSVAVTAPSYTSRNMRCTGVEPTYPGSSSKYYYFRLEGTGYPFSEGTNYAFYRTSW